MNQLKICTAAFFVAFIFSPIGAARAVTPDPDITFTTAKVTILHDSDANSGSPDDVSCGGIKGGLCDSVSLTAAFTVNSGADLLTDLSAPGNTIVVWFGHNTLCSSGQPQAVFHTILTGTKGQSHTSKTAQTYKFVGKTDAVDDSNASMAVPLVDLSINFSINTQKKSGTLKLTGTGDFKSLTARSDGTVGFALVTNEATGDSDDQTSTLVSGSGDLNCTDTVQAKYKEADPD